MAEGPHNFGVTNPAPHVHTPVQTEQGPICTQCRQVVIVPILDSHDPRVPTFTLKADVLHYNAVIDLQQQNRDTPTPIDFMLITLADALNRDWPDYTEKVAQKYAGNPPHVHGGVKVD